MEIIKKGYLNRARKPRRFECQECGCVFKAYEGEYEVRVRGNEISLLACKCPTCGESCYRYDLLKK